MNDYHGYGGFNGGWVNMDEFFVQAGLAAELCAKYKYALLSLNKIKVKNKLELHVL